MTDEVASKCQKCGASVYKQHIDSGIARYEGGSLMCAHCCAEFERDHDASSGAATSEFEAITLDDDDDDVHDSSAPTEMSQSKITSARDGLGLAGVWDDAKFRRRLDPKTTSAMRCRTFHAKLNEASLQFMNNQINEWIDADDSLLIKFAASTIGVFEGKHSEPNLILTLFY